MVVLILNYYVECVFINLVGKKLYIRDVLICIYFYCFDGENVFLCLFIIYLYILYMLLYSICIYSVCCMFVYLFVNV